MNLDSTNPPKTFLRPRFVIAGLLIGFVVMAIAGHWAARRNYHTTFTRFYPQISPEGLYYPTVSEMRSIVRARCRADQTLVIVGGNSIFYGVGQPVGEIWTERLQENLGPDYCVVNFAFRGATPSDGGAVIAEMLRDEFPRLIYIANEAPLKPMAIIGSGNFRFLFWEAYFKGWLENYLPRKNYISQTFFPHDPEATRPRWELWCVGELDHLLAFHDFWNWIAYSHFFTVPLPYQTRISEVIAPKESYGDQEDDGRLLPFSKRFREEVWEPEMKIVRGFTSLSYEKNAAKEWRVKSDVRDSFLFGCTVTMSERLRRRTLMVVSKNSPFYVHRLSEDERVRDELGIQDSLKLWREAGYEATTYPDGIVDEDYLDRTHLLPSGGKKLAAGIADNIRDLAKKLGYSQKSP